MITSGAKQVPGATGLSHPPPDLSDVLGRHVQFEPSVSYTRNAQWLDRSGRGNESQYQDAYDAQARLSTVLERIYDTNWVSASRIKHKIVPSLLYNYRVRKEPNPVQPWFESIDADGP